MRKNYLFALLLMIGAASCSLINSARYLSPDISDNQKFHAKTISEAPVPYRFPSNGQNVVIDAQALKGRNRTDFESYLKSHNTVAFIIIRNDTIIYENYFQGYSHNSQIPAFSVTKAVTSSLIGLAIEDGFIQSVDEPVTNYLPEMKKNGFEKVTIKHLLQMTSGIKFREEGVSPFHEDAKFYYGTNLRQKTLNLKLKREPGTAFEYASGNTQLLALILERSLQGKSISTYLQEKIWHPLGMESEASWSTDKRKQGMEKAFCCLNATARDLAKFGNLYLRQGRWNGQQILPADWIKESTVADTTEGGEKYYKYQWWLSSSSDFLAEGIINQYIYVSPEKNLVFVKLSSGYGVWNKWTFFGDLIKQL